MLLHPVALLLVAVSLGRDAVAQARENDGLTGSVALGTVRYELNDRSETHMAGGVIFGYRVRLFDWGPATISISPQVGLTVSRFRGIALNSDEIAFSRLDVPSVQLAARIRNVRVFAVAQRGKITIERYAGGELVNYSGSADAYGFGVQLPRDNPCGAGLEFGVRRMSGSLTEAESRGAAPPSAGGDVRATLITIGWGGRFRGTRVLFDCR